MASSGGSPCSRRSSRSRRATSPSVFEALDVTPPALERDSYTLDQFLEEVVGPAGPVRPVQRPQAPRPVRRQRLHLGGDGRGDRRARRPDDRHRVPGRRGGRRGGPPGRSRGLRQHELSARGWPLSSTGDRPATPSSTSARTRSSSTSASATRRTAWHRIVDRAEVTRLGEGLVARRRHRAGRAGAHGDGDRRHGRRGHGARRRSRSWRSAPPGCGPPRNSDGGHRRDPRRGPASRSRRSPARRRAGWPTWRPSQRTGHPRGLGGRRSIPAAAARSSRSGATTRVDERFSLPVGAVRYTERFGLGERRHGRSPRRGAWPRSPPTWPASTAGRRRTRLIAMGGAVTNLAAVKHRARDVRPGRRQQEHASTAPRSTARSSSSARRTPTRAGRSSGCSRAAPRSSSPGPASSGRSWTSWGRTR